MKRKNNIESALRDTRVVAIIRGCSRDECLKLCEAYALGGIRLVEVTFNQRSPETWRDTAETIRVLKERFTKEMCVGGGTVMRMDQLDMLCDSGGEFMVSPNVSVELIRESVRRDLVAMPGVLTPSEAVVASEAGAQFVKLFPAGSLGSEYVKAICAPLSHISFLAVGGVGHNNAAAFIKAGCVGVGVGGNLTNKEWIAAGEWEKISAAAKELVERTHV